jgi:membrane protein required for colicin V production
MESSLNIIDIVIITIFLISIIMGFIRGLVSEVLSLLTLIAAFVIAIMFSNALSGLIIQSHIVQSMVNQSSAAMGTSTAQPAMYMALGISFGLLFAGTVLVGTVVKTIVNLLFKTGILGVGNRIFGAVFGLVRGWLINLVLIFIVQLSPVANEPWWQQSSYVPRFQPAVVWLGSVVSPALANLKDTFTSTMQSMSSSVQGFTGGSR